LEKHFDAFKKVHKFVLACANISSCLRDVLQWLMRSY
jgi:hypothetical protein